MPINTRNAKKKPKFEGYFCRRAWATVDAGPTGYPAKEKEDLVQLGFFPCNLSSRTIK